MKVNPEDEVVKLYTPEGEPVVVRTPHEIPRDQSSAPRQLLAALWRVATTARAMVGQMSAATAESMGDSRRAALLDALDDLDDLND